MKKLFTVVGMLVIGATLFAQVNFSLDGHLATNFSSVAPTIGVEINFEKIDVLAGVNFWIYESKRTDKDYRAYSTDATTSQNWFEIFTGIAPKAVITENWTLTFPLLAKIHFRTDEFKYAESTVYSSDTVKKADYFGFAFDIGTRAYYALTPNWSIYGGFLFEIFSVTNVKDTHWKTLNTTYTREYDTTIWFDNGNVEFGVRFTF